MNLNVWTWRMAGPLVRTCWMAARPMRMVSWTFCPSARTPGIP